MELDAIPVFVKVAQLGSFTQASKALNMPNTTVSAKVAQLERALGVKKVIAFRSANTAIRRGKLTSYATQDVCAFTKEAGTKKVLVISNLRNAPATFSIPQAVAAASWKDAFTNSKRTLNGNILLEPYSYIVLKN